MTKQDAAQTPVELLREAREFIESRSEEMGYGFYRPENPHDFTPDSESCTPEEIANHKAACEAWDRGDYKREQGSEWLASDDGKPFMHILRAPWGIGSYVVRDEQATKLLAKLDAALNKR